MRIFRLTFALFLPLLFSLPSLSQITSTRLGDGTGEDWEPAIVADGSYVYALWPHYAATSYKDTSGATCMPFSLKGGGKNNTAAAYMYFQMSFNGTWSTVVIPLSRIWNKCRRPAVCRRQSPPLRQLHGWKLTVHAHRGHLLRRPWIDLERARGCN